MSLTLLLSAAAMSLDPPAAAYAERELSAGPSGVLKGALLQPSARPKATMLIIPGSGPTNRDGDNPIGRSQNLKLLAEALATRGIATVRIDKRGMFSSAAAGDPNKASIALYAEDVKAWIAATRAATGAKCVWLAGHSEGGIVALASARHPGVCGLVLLATPGRKLGDTLREQLRANPANAPLLANAEGILAELEAGRRVDALAIPPALSGLFRPEVQDYFIDLLRQDTPAMVRATKLPVLVVQGGRDLQVTAADADALGKARPGVARADFPAMSHVLKDAPADRAGNFATYAQSALPLTEGLADRIAAFVTEKRK